MKRSCAWFRPETKEKERENGKKAEDSSGQAKSAAAVMAKQGIQKGVFGGVYIPPFRLAQMMKECEDKTSQNYQRLTWDALRKSLNGVVNKVNSANMRKMLPEVFSEVRNATAIWKRFHASLGSVNLSDDCPS